MVYHCIIILYHAIENAVAHTMQHACSVQWEVLVLV